PLEVLHHVRNVHDLAIDAGLGERAIEELPRRPDERMAREILGVSRLLAHQHDLRMTRPLAEHRLRRVPVEIARAALARRVAEPVETRALRNQLDDGRPVAPPPPPRGQVCVWHVGGAWAWRA